MPNDTNRPTPGSRPTPGNRPMPGARPTPGSRPTPPPAASAAPVTPAPSVTPVTATPVSGVAEAIKAPKKVAGAAMKTKNLIIGALGVAAVTSTSLAIALPLTLNQPISFSNKDFYVSPASGSTQDLENAFLTAKERGAEVIVGNGFSFGDAIKSMYAKDATGFNDTGLIINDDAVADGFFGDDGWVNQSASLNSNFYSNIANIEYRADLGSFMTGIALAEFLDTYRTHFTKKENGEELTFGTYGGEPYPSVVSFMYGLQRGVGWWNENVATDNNSKIKQEYVSETDPAKNYAGSFGPDGGNSLIENLLEKDVDVIMPVAGPQTEKAVDLILQKKSHTRVIGVDSAQELSTINGKSSKPIEAASNDDAATKKIKEEVIIFSSEKRLGDATYKILDKINNNSTPDDNIGGLGYSSVGSLDNGLVGASTAANKYIGAAAEKLGKDITTVDGLITEFQKSGGVIETLDTRSEDGFRFALPTSGATWTPTYTGGTAGEKDSYVGNQEAKDIHSLSTEGKWRKAGVDPLTTAIAKAKKSFMTEFEASANTQDDQYVKELVKQGQKVQIILTDNTSVINDFSFSESTYTGVRAWLREYGINIPKVR